jgi:hypothetical protein
VGSDCGALRAGTPARTIAATLCNELAYVVVIGYVVRDSLRHNRLHPVQGVDLTQHDSAPSRAGRRQRDVGLIGSNGRYTAG